VTGASTRAPNIHYATNQLFIDVVEEVNLLVSSKRTILMAEVIGQVNLKVFKLFYVFNWFRRYNLVEILNVFLDLMTNFSLMHIMKFFFICFFLFVFQMKQKMGGRNSEVLELDDIRFHPCVKLGKFSTDRSIAFIPPDGEFTLMRWINIIFFLVFFFFFGHKKKFLFILYFFFIRYRVSDRVVRPPFRVTPLIVEHSKTRFIVQVNVNSTFKPQFVANSVLVKVC
jgi:AP-2 complex subunit mu-1